MASLLWPIDLQPTKTTTMYFKINALSNKAAVLEVSYNETFSKQHRYVAVIIFFLVVSKSSMLMCVVYFRSSLLEIFYCQYIRIMFRRHFVWKVECFIRYVYVSACANMCACVHGCLRA